MNKKRVEITVTGIVQGVGFRPFVYNLAKSLGLNGWVNNFGAAVVVDIEGTEDKLNEFINRLESQAPPLSQIKEIITQPAAFKGYTDFMIELSSECNSSNIYISTDVSICPDCCREVLDRNDRRFLYPFINCTNCGPRFTIITGVPYDRVKTTMKEFTMCQCCASEYNDPADRRYHAQPISCYDCGPRLELLDNGLNRVDVENPVQYSRKLLSEGHILAVKGLGGYHLACDALNQNSVRELRKRKIRDDKPFALMVKDFQIALKYCYINEAEKKLLESEKKPIVLLRKREDIRLPAEIAPGNPYLGVMLPYTPAHLLLFEDITHQSCTSNYNSQLSALVMTSGNRSSEPIYYRDKEAFENLYCIADYFLTNNRDIYMRTDDTVTRVFNNREYIIRRSRGYVPMPITCGTGLDELPAILACGGELKNTFCVNKGNEFYISHHIGDLENTETLESFEEGIEHFKNLFGIRPEAVAYDLHPEYLSTKYALELDIGHKIPIQHHHAHIASCMAENNLNENVIGIAFDGTGYGEDGHIWGGEFFIGGYSGFRRAGHLEYVKMPGGQAAIKEPWRMALSYLYSYEPELAEGKDCCTGLELDGLTILGDIERGRIDTVIQMLDRNINSPLTSSAGRLFDAVSALIGVRSCIRYEGQAAIELEHIVDEQYADSYDFSILNENGRYIVCLKGIFKGIIEDIKQGMGKSLIASKFHESVACIIAEMCCNIRDDCGLNKAVFSGGVFQNITLLQKSIDKLRESGFDVYIHSKVPSNDGGISLGQAVMAAVKLKESLIE